MRVNDGEWDSGGKRGKEGRGSRTNKSRVSIRDEGKFGARKCGEVGGK